MPDGERVVARWGFQSLRRSIGTLPNFKNHVRKELKNQELSDQPSSNYLGVY